MGKYFRPARDKILEELELGEFFKCAFRYIIKLWFLSESILRTYGTHALNPK